MKVKSLFIFSLLVFGLFFASSAFATSPSSILINVAPENPDPGEAVTITLNSYAVSLDSVQIDWVVDGKDTLSGIGEKKFSFNAKGAGVATNVIAKIFLPDGEIDRTIIIAPQVMSLLWQATGAYVPPFYKGKSLPTEEGSIRVVAFPEYKNANGISGSKNLVYEWKKDYNNMADAGGYGKNYFDYDTDYLDGTLNISVKASSVDQQYVSTASVDLPTDAKPKILFYRKDSKLGTVWDNIISDGYLIKGDDVIVAAPYFISPKNLNTPTLKWNWSINDTAVDTPAWQKSLLPVKSQAGVTGEAKISVTVSSIDKLLQEVFANITVNF